MSYAKTIALKLSHSSSLFRDVSLVIFVSLVIGLFGKVAIPLPFTPIPIATQNTLVLLMALFLGARRGTAATFAFLTQGVMGLPVFAGAVGGFATLLGPRGAIWLDI